MIVGLGIPAFIAGIVSLGGSEYMRQLRAGKPTIWEKFWRGSFAHALGRLASLRLRDAAVPADRATEVAIAISVESLFASLDKETRKLLGDVPAVLHGLQERAKTVRQQIAQLDASLAELERHPARSATRQRQEELLADCRAVRDAAASRLTTVVTALETIRLDLLRLHAGVGKVESITVDLAAAENIGRDTERLLAGRYEVDRLVAPQSTV